MYAVKNAGGIEAFDLQAMKDMAAGIEGSICEVLVKKSIRASILEDAPRLVIAGGVAANQTLREMLFMLAEEKGVEVYLPHPKHCTDNAAMISYAAFQHLFAGISTPSDWDAMPRWMLSS